MSDGTRSVVLLAGRLDVGGEARRLGRLAGRLAERGILAKVLCIAGGRAVTAEGVDAVECPWMAHRWLRRLGRPVLAARRPGPPAPT